MSTPDSSRATKSSPPPSKQSNNHQSASNPALFNRLFDEKLQSPPDTISEISDNHYEMSVEANQKPKEDSNKPESSSDFLNSFLSSVTEDLSLFQFPDTAPIIPTVQHLIQSVVQTPTESYISPHYQFHTQTKQFSLEINVQKHGDAYAISLRSDSELAKLIGSHMSELLDYLKKKNIQVLDLQLLSEQSNSNSQNPSQQGQAEDSENSGQDKQN